MISSVRSISRRVARKLTKQQPQVQRAEAAREFDAVVEERERLVVRLLEDFDVVRARYLSPRRARALRLAQQQTATIHRRVEPLVRVERDRVGACEARE